MTRGLGPDHIFEPVKAQTGCRRCGYARGQHPTRAQIATLDAVETLLTSLGRSRYYDDAGRLAFWDGTFYQWYAIVADGEGYRHVGQTQFLPRTAIKRYRVGTDRTRVPAREEPRQVTEAEADYEDFEGDR